MISDYVKCQCENPACEVKSSVSQCFCYKPNTTDVADVVACNCPAGCTPNHGAAGHTCSCPY